jgi:FtsP/CotA-like multicopper oxidase with cupredoxin domain
MRKFLVLPFVAMVLLVMVGPSFAQAKPGTMPEAAATVTKPARVRQLVGSIVSVDAQAKTVVVQRTAKGKSQEYTFAADKDAAGALAQLKPGERVRVTYTEANGRMTAEKITDVGHSAKK